MRVGGLGLMRVAQDGIHNQNFCHILTSIAIRLEQRQENARGNRGTDHARDVRAHGVHQDEVAGIFFLRHLLRNARGHRHGPKTPAEPISGFTLPPVSLYISLPQHRRRRCRR